MLRIFVVLFSTLALSLGALAQEERSKSAAYLEAQSILLQARQRQRWEMFQARQQERREMLRETLKLQRAEGPLQVRQMTAQEKAELRQQLRQQPQDLVRKEDQ
jgi:hypothetical protein